MNTMNPAEKAQKFRSFVETMSGRVVIIVSQIDPDAIGSAFGLMYILKKLGKENNIEIYFSGSIGHPQNRSIIYRFGLSKKMKPVEELKVNETDSLVLVDSSSLADSRMSILTEIFSKKKPVIVIDHHRGDDIPSNDDNFILIEEVGAASTLVVELLRGLEIIISDEDKYVAILLTLGIYTDTKALISGGRRDIEAYSFVSGPIVYDDVAHLINYPLPPSYYDNLEKALGGVVVNSERLVTGLGHVDPQNSDDISSIADHLIRRSGVSLVVVWGIVGNVVRLSARAKDISLSLDDFLKTRFPGSGAKLAPDGHGEGGAVIALTGLERWMSDTTKPLIVELISKRIEEIVFEN